MDLTAIVAALATATDEPGQPKIPYRQAQLERKLTEAKARIEILEQENRELNSRLARIAALAAGVAPVPVAPEARPDSRPKIEPKPPRPVTSLPDPAPAEGLHPAARKLVITAARHTPACFTWGQLATLAGLKPSGGHFDAGRKELRDAQYITERQGLVAATPAGMKVAGEMPPAPSTPAERLALWCARLPSPAPEMLRALAARGERYMDADELASALGKKPSGGHWNSRIAVLRNNALIETDGRRYRTALLFRQ